MEQKSNKRNPNFSESEKRFLVELVNGNESKLFGKFSKTLSKGNDKLCLTLFNALKYCLSMYQLKICSINAKNSCELIGFSKTRYIISKSVSQWFSCCLVSILL